MRRHISSIFKSKSYKKSKYMGVIYVEEDSQTPWWGYYSTYQDLNILIGCFSNEAEAATARDKKLFNLFGQNVKLNFK